MQMTDNECISDLLSMDLHKFAEADLFSEGGRAWIPECGAGDIVFKAACVLHYKLHQSGRAAHLRVFGTDLNADNIQQARLGVLQSVDGLPDPLLQTCFMRGADDWRVKPPLRDYCLFSQHDLFVNAPFTKLDLLVCNGLPDHLMTTEAFQIWHYALKPGGLLWSLNPPAGEAHLYFQKVTEDARFYRKVGIQRIKFPKGRVFQKKAISGAALTVEESLQMALEDLSAANEELQTSHEELLVASREADERSAALKSKNDDLKNLLGSLSMPVIMVDHESKIRLFNKTGAEALHFRETDVGTPITRMNLGVQIDNLEDKLMHVFKTGEIIEKEVEDKRHHWFLFTIRPYIDNSGRRTGAVLTLLDINDRKIAQTMEQEARKRAETDNESKDLFLSTLSHELRTPLTPILNWAELMRVGKLSPELETKALNAIERCVKTQLQLIEDLLDTSRIVSGKLSLEYADVEIRKVLESAIETVKPALQSKSIQLDTEWESEGVVCGDETRLQQVFWNILSNAVKFSPQGGRIRVKCSREENKIKVLISDNGDGIEANNLETIFDRFKQVDSSYTRKQGGLGLGLSIARAIVEMHRGKIKAESEGSGKGTAFTVTLPLSFRELAHGSARLEPVVNSLGGIVIAIVDDDSDTLESLAFLLRSLGATVHTASSAPEATDLLDSVAAVDLLICDISMPDESGFSVIARLRAHKDKKIAEIPVMALTAYASRKDHDRTLKAGFDVHVAKPATPAEIISEIKRLLSKHMKK